MPLIVLDGPEKAGKTTIANAILAHRAGHGNGKTRIRHWSHVDPDDRRYAIPLAEDCMAVAAGGTVIWDRSWAAEHVYAALMGRDRRLREDPWLGEWLYGRAVMTMGVRVMVLGPSVQSLIDKRDTTDLPVDPRAERSAFAEYAAKFKWMTVIQQHTEQSLRTTAEAIFNTALAQAANAPTVPPKYAGPNDPSVIFVGEERANGSAFPGGWLPFSTPTTIEFARLVPRSLDAGWLDVADCPPQALRRARTIISCGDRAAKWVHFHVAGSDIQHVGLAHPSYALRVNTKAAHKARAMIEHALRDLAQEVIHPV